MLSYSHSGTVSLEEVREQKNTPKDKTDSPSKLASTKGSKNIGKQVKFKTSTCGYYSKPSCRCSQSMVC
jgi:hypothetical protein